MQEEINHKTITVYIKGAKVTANSLKAALRAVLRAKEKHKQNVQHREAAYQEEDVAVNRGKQSLRELQTKGSELSNIEITDENIKSFERYARKYGIDYALKRTRRQTHRDTSCSSGRGMSRRWRRRSRNTPSIPLRRRSPPSRKSCPSP